MESCVWHRAECNVLRSLEFTMGILSCCFYIFCMVVRAVHWILYLKWNQYFILTCICLIAGIPTEMTFNTTSTVMTSQRDNTMRHDNALPVTCHSRCASHRTMHMPYRSKTYTWNDVILVKRSMIRVFLTSYMNI